MLNDPSENSLFLWPKFNHIKAYFQRVLSANSANNARVQSIFAGFACMAMAIPSIFIGAAAKATDWDTIFAQEVANTTKTPMRILVSSMLTCVTTAFPD